MIAGGVGLVAVSNADETGGAVGSPVPGREAPRRLLLGTLPAIPFEIRP
jgi:hypothetical protein